MADLKVRDYVTLTSPGGREFKARWEGGTRSVKKRLAMYAYAGVNGQVVDDYGSDSVTYPINLVFDGEGHRKEAKDFFDEFQSRGKWKVIHPTEGTLGLQGVEATENDQPVKEVSVTRIDTQWVEYIDPITLKTLRNALLELGFAVNEMDDASRNMAAAKMDMSPAGLKEAELTGVSVLDAVKSAYNKAQYAAAAAADAQEAFKDAIASGIIAAANFVSTMQNLIAAPGRALADLKARIQTLKNILDDLFGDDKKPPEPNRNDAVLKEVVAASVLSSIAEGVFASSEGEESGLRSRTELLSAISAFDEVVDTILTEMDALAIESVTAGMEVEKQYIPFETSRNEFKNIVAKTRNALRDQFFKLPVEKRIILKTPMTVFQIAKEYYGTTGDNDEYLQRIEDANGFTSDQILLIPAGTQVRIYV